MISVLIAAAEGGEEAPNFLLPNATFLVELGIFALLVFVLAKWVIPPINKAMIDRQAAIKAQFDEAAKLKADAQAADEAHKAALAEARHEATKIREEAREQGVQIIAQHREQAQVEADRVTANAHAQIDVERAQTLAQLKSEVGTIATTLAGRIVGESLDDDERQKRTVDRFIADLESSN
ncbi:MAG TPA: F0F1 ATP synthase subunit B [Aeromicrobium sp.]|nr:F0F1 ATP synthase subunit B [Aeromicrobium sp.]